MDNFLTGIFCLIFGILAGIIIVGTSLNKYYQDCIITGNYKIVTTKHVEFGK